MSSSAATTFSAICAASIAQRPVADQPQRAHPERRVAEVEEPHALAAVAAG